MWLAVPLVHAYEIPAEIDSRRFVRSPHKKITNISPFVPQTLQDIQVLYELYLEPLKNGLFEASADVALLASNLLHIIAFQKHFQETLEKGKSNVSPISWVAFISLNLLIWPLHHYKSVCLSVGPMII